MTKELGQGGLGQSLNVHPGLLTEVGKLPDKLGSTVRVLTVHLPGATGGGSHNQFLAAAGTDHGHLESAALGFVFCNLRNDLVGLVNHDLIAHTKLERIEDVQIV